jgi:DNA-binding NarL/FixJ family response regulator
MTSDHGRSATRPPRAAAPAHGPDGEPRPARILLVDDHPLVRQGLASLISAEPDLEVCGEASGEPAAWNLLLNHSPDLVIIDLTLEKGSGIDLIRRIRSEYPDIALLVVSLHDEVYFIERALRAGAWGYLTKQEALDKVLVAIRQLLSGQVYLSDRLSPGLLRRLMSGARDEGDSTLSALSDREMQVFLMIGSGLGAQEIADKLQLSVKTIETYQAHVKEKLNLKGSRQLVQYAVRWAVSHKPPES